MDKWQEHLKPEEAIRLEVIADYRAAGIREARRIRDRAYRRMVRAQGDSK